MKKYLKKITNLLLSVMMVAVVLPMSIASAEVIRYEAEGANATFKHATDTKSTTDNEKISGTAVRIKNSDDPVYTWTLSNGTEITYGRYFQFTTDELEAGYYDLRVAAYAPNQNRNVYIMDDDKKEIASFNINWTYKVHTIPNYLINAGENKITIFVTGTGTEANKGKHEVWIDYIELEKADVNTKTLTVPAAGKYSLKITYSNATEAVEISKNDTIYTVKNPTAGENQTDYVVAELDAGSNTFILGDAVTNVELIEDGSITYRARNISTKGGAWNNNQGGIQPGSGNTNDTFVLLDGSSVTGDRWVKMDFEIAKAGTYKISLTGKTGTHHAWIADANKNVIFNTGNAGWNWPTNTTAYPNTKEIFLNEGMNTLYFGALNGTNLGNGAVITTLTATKVADKTTFIDWSANTISTGDISARMFTPVDDVEYFIVAAYKGNILQSVSIEKVTETEIKTLTVPAGADTDTVKAFAWNSDSSPVINITPLSK